MASTMAAKNGADRHLASKDNKDKQPTPEHWTAWCAHLRRRKTPRSLGRLMSTDKSLLCWPLDDLWHGSGSERLVGRLERFAETGQGAAAMSDQLQQWLEERRTVGAEPKDAIECLAWAHALPRLAQHLPAAPWHELLEQLLALASEAAPLEQGPRVVVEQILAGELPLTLAYLFPEIPECRQLFARAQQVLSDTVVEVLDGEGLPAARYLPAARPLLSCWTRCGYLSKGLGRSVFGPDAVHQLGWFVQQTVRLLRDDGSQVLTNGPSGAACPSLLESALRLFGDRKIRQAAELLRGRGANGGAGASPSARRLPAPSVHSEWAEVGLLRTRWQGGAPHLAVRYDSGRVETELNANGSTLWSGLVQAELSIDGRPVPVEGEWSEVCWHSDEDVDYLELELDLPGGRSLQRQFLLARQDGFAYVADAVLGEEPAELDQTLRLPLAEGIHFAAAEESREGWLESRKRLALVLPLALPEWRSERAAGELTASSEGLELRLHSRARRQLAPLFFDLDTRRHRKPFTWRRLTVAERLEIQSSDVAAGYRIQIGFPQWLIYRSLQPYGNRSVLGQNFSSDFVAARFRRDGEIEKLLEIE